MKRLKLVLVMLLSFTLTGCIQKYSATDEQSDAIAEYMAGALLLSDKNYDQGLTSMEDINADDQAGDSDTPKENTGASGSGDAAASDNSGKAPASGTDSTDGNQYTLSEVIGKKYFDIKYASYKLTESYPENPDSAYFSISPRTGYELMVITFSVKNTSSKEREFDLSKTDINYKLDVNVGTIYKPQFTLLENDLRYIDLSIKAGETKEAVLVFEVSKDIDTSKSNLVVSNSDKSETIVIK